MQKAKVRVCVNISSLLPFFGLTASISPPHPHPHRKTGLDKLQHSGASVKANWEERVNVHGCLESDALGAVIGQWQRSLDH